MITTIINNNQSLDPISTPKRLESQPLATGRGRDGKAEESYTHTTDGRTESLAITSWHVRCSWGQWLDLEVIYFVTKVNDSLAVANAYYHSHSSKEHY